MPQVPPVPPARLNFASMERSASTATSTGLAVLDASPLQPPKKWPAAGTALSVTVQQLLGRDLGSWLA